MVLLMGAIFIAVIALFIFTNYSHDNNLRVVYGNSVSEMF